MSDDLFENMVTVLTAITPILLALWRVYNSPLGQEIFNSVRSGNVSRARQLLSAEAFSVVAKYKQKFVDGLKQDLADGVLKEEELKARLAEVKAEALADFKKNILGSAFLQALDTLGIKDVEAYLDQLLETEVLKLKLAAPTQLAEAPS